MAKKNGPNAGIKLGIEWGKLKRSPKTLYNGTVNGLKNNIVRANKVYAPRRFTWTEKDGKLYVWRMV